MYKLKYMPKARRDIVEIGEYVSKVLGNPQAAHRLVSSFIEEGKGILTFPYANPVYISSRPLKYEYRKLLVKNYLMVYRVDETRKLVIVVRIIYAKRNCGLLLE